VVARQLFKRLENEGELSQFVLRQLIITMSGFVATETKTTDEVGFLETSTRAVKGKSKAKGKQANQRKNLQKTKYLFNKASKRTSAYKDYFNPDQVVENRLLGLSDLVCELNNFPLGVSSQICGISES
jgi:meiosis-specific protein HOP1